MTDKEDPAKNKVKELMRTKGAVAIRDQIGRWMKVLQLPWGAA